MKKKRWLILFLYLYFAIASPVMAWGEGTLVYRTNSLSVPTSSWYALPWPLESGDDDDLHATGDEEFIATGDGWYIVCANVIWGSSTNSDAQVSLNSNSQGRFHFNNANTSYVKAQSVCGNVHLYAGDWVRTEVYISVANTVTAWSSMSAIRTGYSMSDLNGHAMWHESNHTDAINVTGLQGVLATPQPPQIHHATHEDGGSDELNVSGLSGILTDTQDAGWLQNLAITTTAPTDGQALVWNDADSEWQPATISGTGETMPDIITATISGTVPVIITSTYQYTEALSSGNQMAIIRSFTYGEASIAIGLFVVAVLLGLHLLFSLRG